MPDTDMMTRVARAIYDVAPNRMAVSDTVEPWDEAIFRQEECYQMARAALSALREPTEAMLEPAADILSHFAGEHGDYNVYFTEEQGREIWQAMIDAALTDTLSQEERKT